MEAKKDIKDTIQRMVRHGVRPMTEKNYEKVEIVSKQLDDFTSLLVGDHELSYIDVYAMVLSNFSLYDDYSFIYHLYTTMDQVHLRSPQEFSPSSKVLDFSSCIRAKNDGSFHAASLQIPQKLDNMSHVYFSHECHHILKDTNPREYSDMLRYADVIPQFFELVLGDYYNQNGDSIIHNRLNILSLSKHDIDEHFNREKRTLLTDMIDSKKCQYFHSFYYSILLYQLYLENPKKVLKTVKKVLTHDMTTADLLEQYGLTQTSFDDDVEKGIQFLKRK